MARESRLFVSSLAALAAAAVLVTGCGTSDSSAGGSATSSSGASSGSGSGTGSTGSSSGHGGSNSSSGATGSTSGSSSGSSGGSGSSSGSGGGDDGGTGDDATVGDDATTGGDGGACVPNTSNGWDSNDAGYGCNNNGQDMGLNPPSFCDNGIRMMPPTCNSLVDEILARTPLADKQHPCKVPTNGQAYNLDESPTDSDTLAGRTAEMCKLNGAVYWVADQDIDCDGRRTATCPGSPPNMDCCFQNQDTFGVNADGSINATDGKTNPFSSADDQYVVIPDNNWQGLVPPGTIVAVVYGNKVTYAIFADTGPTTVIGEGSVALANALGYPSSPATGGVVGNVVTYIAFTGQGTVPSKVEDRATIDALGNQLIQQFIANNPP